MTNTNDIALIGKLVYRGTDVPDQFYLASADTDDINSLLFPRDELIWSHGT